MTKNKFDDHGHRATVQAHHTSMELRLTFHGNFDAAGTASVWDSAIDPVKNTHTTEVIVDCSDVRAMDGSGIALLLKIREETARAGGKMQLVNLDDQYKQLIDLTWDCDIPDWAPKADERRSFTESVGMATSGVLIRMREMVSFIGESLTMIVHAVLHPRQVRWKDVLMACVNVGVDSIFIITLIGFLMGLIMSFQSAVTLERFGGEIFIPNMLGLVMFREMGPLVTAILLAARSGSAFAAEIGTMKINEELDALSTMGLSPMRFMVLPKLLASLAMVPLMTIFFNMASLIGGAVVMLSLGFPLVTYTSRVFSYLDYVDFWGGMLKAVIFSIIVAGVGCLRGLQTQSGASAVGLSTTSAVVTGIIFLAFADGIFAMVFYVLGW
tara:strand:- start:53996 stop:55144 length:1149 start_codon:yes stop_codon:yes gene_type:complete